MFIKYLIVFFVSMIPLVELRGSIPIGMSEAFGPALNQGTDLVWLYVVAILGNMLPVPFIYFFARKVLVWGTKVNWPKGLKWVGKFFNFCLVRGEKGGKKLQGKAGKGGLFIALLLFVGIPLPGTGACVGTLAASILDMDFKTSVIAVMLGVILAGVIMGLASAGVLGAAGAMFAK